MNRRGGRALSIVTVGLVNLGGVAAFALPFILGAGPGAGEASARAADAPWMLGLLMPLLVVVALVEATRGRLDVKAVALLGVLAGLAALMRLPISFAGANLMFFLPIAAGYVFGATFGFLLGSLAMAASAVITGGIGPWLPFQMWAAGWVGAGAGLLRPLGDRLEPRPVISVGALALYGYVAGLAFGFIINLYFWPLLPADADIAWRPGLGVAETIRHYRSFYMSTSLGWDAFRGIGNAVVIIAAGAPVLDLLRRFRRRFSLIIE